MHIRNMHLYNRSRYSPNSILQSDGRVGIGTGIQDNAIRFKPDLLDSVYHFSFYIGLKIINLNISIFSTQLGQIVFKRNTPVDGRFTLTQQIDVRAVDNLYPHNLSFVKKTISTRK